MIHVGASTETAMKEKKDRVEDALHATRAAVEEGIVPGGGVALVRALEALDGVRLKGDAKHAKDLVKRAISAPLRQIATNAGLDGNVVLEETREKTGAKGMNVATEKWVDMFKDGVVDPAKVIRSALSNASSVVGLMLTTETVVTEIKDDDVVDGAVS